MKLIALSELGCDGVPKQSLCRLCARRRGPVAKFTIPPILKAPVKGKPKEFLYVCDARVQDTWPPGFKSQLCDPESPYWIMLPSKGVVEIQRKGDT